MGIREGVGRVTLILDTNFLMYLVDGSIPLSWLYDALPYSLELAIVGSTIVELERLALSAPRLKDRRKARQALEFINKLGISVLNAPTGNVDDDIVMAASNLRASGRRIVVATGDRELRRRLRNHGVPTLYPRGPDMIPRIDWEPL